MKNLDKKLLEVVLVITAGIALVLIHKHYVPIIKAKYENRQTVFTR
jgi:hypothetical protein